MDAKLVPKLSEPTLPPARSTAHESPNITVRVQPKREPAECRAFRKCFADLTEGITDPGLLAIKLYSKELIGRDIRTETSNRAIAVRDRTVMLLSAVEDQIVTSPATMFREFLDVLQDEPHLHNLAAKLDGELVSILPSTFSPLPIDTYASHLKCVYTREKLPINDKWPPVKSIKYINLALIGKEDITKQEADDFTKATMHGNIDDIKMSKRSINIDQIAHGSQQKCILVEGAPGVGKSTLAWKLCRKWGKGKLLQQYKLVVLLKLRDKSVRAAKNISDLFQYHDNQIQEAIVEEIQRTQGERVLLLFEGYDELPEILRTDNSIFLDVVTGMKLPKATVLITSRPWASEFLHMQCKNHISQHIEILGFTKADIESYLWSTIPNDPSLLADLKQYISWYPHINSLMYIPLNCAIVVEVYQKSRKDEVLAPKTMTELYSSLVRSLLLRYLLDHPDNKKRRKRLRSFKDLPEDVHKQLCELGRIACEGILHGQQVIFSDLPEDFETLGLMQCAPELYIDEGATVSYHFLHLTVQEYLAAFHLSQQPVDEQIDHFKKYMKYMKSSQTYPPPLTLNTLQPLEKQTDRFRKNCTGKDEQANAHLQMVLRFLSGMTKFINYEDEMLKTLCVKESDQHNPSSDIQEVTFDTLHWLFEAQDNDVITKLLGSSDVRLYKPCGHEKNKYMYIVKPFDCFVLGYCVSHSNCTWKIDLKYGIDGCHIGDDGVEMLVRGTEEMKPDCKGRISEIDLHNSDVTVKHLLKLLPLVNKLEALHLGHNKLDSAQKILSESSEAIALMIPHLPHLKKLSLSYIHRIVPGEVVPLIESLISHNSLEKLVLHINGLGVKDYQALGKVLSSTNLKWLGISSDDTFPSEADALISGLCHNTTLTYLDIHFPLNDTRSLASVLRANSTLVHLKLGHCNINSDGACQLASALCENSTLQELDLGDNSIGVKGATAFAKMLLRNKSLNELDLTDDSIDIKGAEKLITSLTCNTTVRILYLSGKYESSCKSSVHSRVVFGGSA